MFSRSEATEMSDVQQFADAKSVNNVAEYESEPVESPLSELNIFEFVDFH
jgi:hypothetical protein